MRWSPEQQIWRKFIEAVEVMGPDKLNAGIGSGWMGGAGDQGGRKHRGVLRRSRRVLIFLLKNDSSNLLFYSISRAASIDSNCCRLPTTSVLSNKSDKYVPTSFDQQFQVSEGHTSYKNKEN